MKQSVELLKKELKRIAVSLTSVKFSGGVRSNKEKPRAALCYLGNNVPAFHSNGKQQSDIYSTLCELGFEVDLFSNRDFVAFPARDYTIVFGFGNSWRRICSLNPSAIKILYATEAPAFVTFLNEQRAIRSATHLLRKPSVIRSYRFYSDTDYSVADHIFQMGKYNCDLLQATLIDASSRVHYIGTYGIGEDEEYTPKSSKTAGYLWFGSAGATMKGLEAVIRIFRNYPHLQLYVAGCTAKEYSDILVPPDNVNYLGKIKVPSPSFDDLASKISFCIFPTGAEGISTGVITCMYKGIVPIVTPHANIEGGQIRIKNVSNEELQRAVESAELLSSADYLRLSQEARNYSTAHYNQVQFIASIREALSKISIPK